MPFQPGQSGNPAGRAPGSKNALHKTVKETVLSVFNELQDDPKHSMIAFARRYPRDFYNIAAKLIPTEMRADIHTPEGVHITYVPDPNCKPLGSVPGMELK